MKTKAILIDFIHTFSKNPFNTIKMRLISLILLILWDKYILAKSVAGWLLTVEIFSFCIIS